ncbi:hypothetical protein GH714_023210 [Hevea brasiliensis]|uniref:Protein kinase domain-containing protein n=1 Tax=Hevea brasiliensis TaxID=3981 RepID=A0A6A6M001_HEVBR|nr:hypothetical protein GH714_023210 [Hevea brasiliensis]
MCDNLKNNYHLCEEVGRGRFGTISRCFSPIKNDFFACKTIDKNLLTDPTDRECLQNEAKIMTILSPHPNIVQIHDVYDTDESLTMVMELCEHYTLYDRIIKSNGGFCEGKSASIMKQLLNAIAHCHRFNIVHRDIKPDNILFDSRNRVKLADFGSADWLGEERTMSAGIPPFYGETVEETFEAVIRGNLRFPPRIFRTVSPAAKDLLRKMICRDVSRRFSAEQALRHPWFVSGGDTISMD